MMLFHSFKNQDERRVFGGSDFLELQFCRVEIGTSIESIVSCRNITNWCNDSLYVSGDDWEVFYENYKNIFKNGVYSNLQSGRIDWCGINYYSPRQVEAIIIDLEEQKPKDYKAVLDWLNNTKDFNGIYILGL